MSKFTVEELIAAAQELPPSQQVESLLGKYADTGDEVTDVGLRAILRESATKWENDLTRY